MPSPNIVEFNHQFILGRQKEAWESKGVHLTNAENQVAGAFCGGDALVGIFESVVVLQNVSDQVGEGVSLGKVPARA